jgi:hypothetical protein
MSPENLIPKEIKIKEKNIVKIYTTDAVTIKKLKDGEEGGRDISQISLVITSLEAQDQLEKSLTNGSQPCWLIEVTLQKSRNQESLKLDKGEFWTWASAWRYFRKKERGEEIDKEIVDNRFFDYFLPSEKDLPKIIEEEELRVRNALPKGWSENEINKSIDFFRDRARKSFIKVKIIKTVEAN